MPISTQLNKLVRHPGHDRTIIAPDPLARLACQIAERGLDKHQPILVAPNGQPDHFYILSGYRRYLALILATAVLELAESDPAKHAPTDTDAGFDAEHFQKQLHFLLHSLGNSLDTAIPQLLGLYGDTDVSVELFNGTLKAQLLTLQAANANREDPDPIGLGHSYLAAVKAGASPAEIARNSGKTVQYVTNLIAVAHCGAEMQQLIAEEIYPPIFAHHLAKLRNDHRTGVEHALSELQGQHKSQRPSSKHVRYAVNWLNAGIPQPPYMTLTSQETRNLARIWVHLLTECDAEKLGYVAMQMAMHAYPDKDAMQQPWRNPYTLNQWFYALLGDEITDGYQIDQKQLVTTYLPAAGVGCATCPLGKLPARILKTDVNDGRTHFPCRYRYIDRTDITTCVNGFAPIDPFRIDLPIAYAQHDGVQQEHNSAFVDTPEALQAAYEAQRQLEIAMDEVEFSENLPVFRMDIPLSDGETLNGFTLLFISDGYKQGWLAEMVIENQPILRTSIRRERTDVVEAVQAGDVIELPYAWEHLLARHRPLRIGSFTSGAFDAQDDKPLAADAADPDTIHFYNKVGRGWTLYLSQQPTLRYFYAIQNDDKLETTTRAHAEMSGVLYDIDGKGLVDVETYNRWARLYVEALHPDTPDGADIDAERDLDASGESAETATDSEENGIVVPEVSNPPATDFATETDLTGANPATNDTTTQAAIRHFMQTHTDFNTAHPFATPCARCRWKRDSSPVVSKPSAPPCEWAKGNRKLGFELLTARAKETGFQSVPVCRQFKPAAEWQEIIPPFPHDVPMPPQWIVHRIYTLVENAQRRSYGSYGELDPMPFEFLTGRPFATSENYDAWFKEQFENAVGDLSLKQLWTLYLWATAEWERVRSAQTILLPVNNQSAQFVDVRAMRYAQ